MSDFQQKKPGVQKKKIGGCLTCFIVLCAGFACIGGTIFVGPIILEKLGFIGRQAKDVYQYAPDIVASQQLEQVFADKNIAGVRVYVIPINGEVTQGAFIILDSSKGYSGLGPIDARNDVFFSLLKDLSLRNSQENLRISHATVDYRDENGESLISFTVDQKDIDSYANGKISREQFISRVHLNLLDTLKQMGLEELLMESKP